MRSLHQLVVVILHCRFMHLGHEIGCNDDDDGDDGRFFLKKKGTKKEVAPILVCWNCCQLLLPLSEARSTVLVFIVP